MTKKQLAEKYMKEFGHVAPVGNQINRIEKVRASYKLLLGSIIEYCPEGDNLTEAVKILDISRMIAVKSIVMEEDKKEPEKLPIIQATSMTRINNICRKHGIGKYYCLMMPVIREDIEELLKLEGEYEVYQDHLNIDEPLIVKDINKYLRKLLDRSEEEK